MKLLILDRDGVINEDSDDFIKHPDEWRAIPGSLAAIQRLTQAGYTIAVATNQSGIARGLYTRETLAAIHDKMRAAVEQAGGHIDQIFVCPHGPNDGCDCRKPRDGLMQQAQQHYQYPLTQVWAVGDSLRDVQAAISAGAQPALVRTGKGLRTLASNDPQLKAVPVFDDLAAFVAYLLQG